MIPSSLRSLLACCMFATAGTSIAVAVPTDNPVASYYAGSDGYPAWTDAVAWDNIIDMAKYAKGKTNFEKFENARDELAARGGGVLYYPAGKYDFTQGPFDGPGGRGLMLKTGIVIRGEAPKGNVDARTGRLELRTRFVFGFQKRGVDAGKKLGAMCRATGTSLVSLPTKGKAFRTFITSAFAGSIWTVRRCTSARSSSGARPGPRATAGKVSSPGTD